MPHLQAMLETERYIDSVFTEGARCGQFTAEHIFPKFLDVRVLDQEGYQRRKNVVDALGFLENKRMLLGEMRVGFTPNLRIPTEVRHYTPTPLGRLVVRAPRVLRVGLFFALLQWKRLVAVLGALAFVRLLYNAYLGVVLLVGWIEHVAILILAWIIYLLIRRALN